MAARAPKWWLSGVTGVNLELRTVATLTACSISSVGSVVGLRRLMRRWQWWYERCTKFSVPQKLSTDSRKRSISPARVRPSRAEAGLEGAMTSVEGVLVVVRMEARWPMMKERRARW